jgi:hypothetical protein
MKGERARHLLFFVDRIYTSGSKIPRVRLKKSGVESLFIA